MATVKKTIKKAQSGKNVPKGMIESEMFPGKMIPKSKSNYENGKISKMVEAGKKTPATKTATKGAKPQMKKGGKIAKKAMPCASCGKKMKK